MGLGGSPPYKKRNMKDALKSKRWTIFVFLFSKIFGALMVINCAIHVYLAILEQSFAAVVLFLVLIVGTAILDGFVLPIRKSNEGIKYWHLWRTSFLENSRITYMYIEHIPIFDTQRKKDSQVMFTRTDKKWQFYHIYADPLNQAKEYYMDKGIGEIKPRYWGH